MKMSLANTPNGEFVEVKLSGAATGSNVWAMRAREPLCPSSTGGCGLLYLAESWEKAKKGCFPKGNAIGHVSGTS